MRQPIILIICDGLGHREEATDNALAIAETPNLNCYWRDYPHAVLQASGEAIGLPKGQMGTSEANHLVIGSGRIVYQNLLKINRLIKNKELAKNQAIQSAMEHVKKHRSVLHLKGMASPGGVHGHLDHLKYLVGLAKEHQLKNVLIHLFTDGRDVPPQSALAYVKELEDYLKKIGLGKIATLGGRYWGLDRDNNLDRIEKHFRVLTSTAGPKFNNAQEAIKRAYEQGLTDEFIEPALIEIGPGEWGCIQSNDAVIFANFRSDRAKQIAKRFVQEKIPNLHYVAMTKYDDDLEVRVALPPEEIKNTLSEVLSRQGLRQLRLTETEKFSHLTFFFNAQRYQPEPGEDRIMIPSDKDIKTYDQKPAMKALELAIKVEELLPRKQYDFIAINLVNCDMVGHTGNFPAIIKAVQAVDLALKRLVAAAQKNRAEVIITADHGNAEQTFDHQTNQPLTSHTLNPVPFILISERYKKLNRPAGILSDIAPTILKMFDFNIPQEMTGRPLV
ncbi:2,3-bisphosphoglycerate-independent phosphoglycerate mutase [Patescibacteria group bacterium]|nr:2,3-bisphosphoglycerate-independent phosphoglycerate mutase [Patescibacteria group bacterium]